MGLESVKEHRGLLPLEEVVLHVGKLQARIGTKWIGVVAQQKQRQRSEVAGGGGRLRRRDEGGGVDAGPRAAHGERGVGR